MVFIHRLQVTKPSPEASYVSVTSQGRIHKNTSVCKMPGSPPTGHTLGAFCEFYAQRTPCRSISATSLVLSLQQMWCFPLGPAFQGVQGGFGVPTEPMSAPRFPCEDSHLSLILLYLIPLF